MESLPKGQYIKHYRYGFGLILESNDEATSIEFESIGHKSFVTRLMEVELSDLTPPKQFQSKWVKSPVSSRMRSASSQRRLVRKPAATPIRRNEQ